MITRNRTAYNIGFSEGLYPDVSVNILMNNYNISDSTLRRAFRTGYRHALRERKPILVTWSYKMYSGLKRRVQIG